MKIAIPNENNMVCPHFGHAPVFTIVEVLEGKIKERNDLISPGHQPGSLPIFLAEKGVNCVITGGMGAHAQELFQEKGIQVITGAKGDIMEALEKFLAGKLVSSAHVCNEHEHAGECGGH